MKISRITAPLIASPVTSVVAPSMVPSNSSKNMRPTKGQIIAIKDKAKELGYDLDNGNEKFNLAKVGRQVYDKLKGPVLLGWNVEKTQKFLQNKYGGNKNKVSCKRKLGDDFLPEGGDGGGAVVAQENEVVEEVVVVEDVAAKDVAAKGEGNEDRAVL